jgi:uncharacterized sulfatase
MIRWKRLAYILMLALTGPGSLLPNRAVAQQADSIYNVLFIAVDDLNTDLSSYGHPLVKTPNFERLAKRSVQFNRAYCQYPLCNPSRASLLTGLYPDVEGVYDLKTFFRKNIPDLTTLPQLFKNNGYYTARVGKIFHYGVPGQIGTNGMDDSVSWNRVINPKGRDVFEKSKIIKLLPIDLSVSLCYLAAGGRDEEQTDGIGATEAIKLLAQQKGKKNPFFIALGFYRPHTPYVAPKKYFDLYPVENIRLPANPPGDLKDIPDVALWTKPANWGLSEEKQKEAIRGYYAATSFIDAQLGRVLDALDSLGLREHTIVVLWSDHGYNLGEHGQWEKRSLFDKCNRVPFMISVPGGIAGRISERVVELVDLYPTLAGLCRLQAPQNLSGISLEPLLKDPDARWDHAAYSQVLIADPRGREITNALGFKVPDNEGAYSQHDRRMGRSVRTGRWRYTEWDYGKLGVELYDEINDPQEFNNLANRKESGKLVRKLSQLLKQHFKDPFPEK